MTHAPEVPSWKLMSKGERDSTSKLITMERKTSYPPQMLVVNRGEKPHVFKRGKT